MINIQKEFDAQKATIDLLMSSKTNKQISECNSQSSPKVGSRNPTCSQNCQAIWMQVQEELASIKTELGETNKHISERNSQPPPEVGSRNPTSSQTKTAKLNGYSYRNSWLALRPNLGRRSQ